jgi:hypothetical protein
MFILEWTETARLALDALKLEPHLAKRLKAVTKALRLLSDNPRHPGLSTHEWKSTLCPHGEKLWEAYAENQTAGAYRIFFCYPPGRRGTICIVAITPHP